jgi:hypothetical protein
MVIGIRTPNVDYIQGESRLRYFSYTALSRWKNRVFRLDSI